MFSLAYVLLPFSDEPVADAITSSLARFRRGRRDELPDAWLGFDDETAAVQAMHQACFRFRWDEGLRIDGGDSWFFRIDAIKTEMERRGTRDWTVRFSDIEREMEAFAARFLKPFDRHPITGGYGFWHNALGRWDWWELGGRFDGAITGARRRNGRARSSIFSGPSRGRDLLNQIEDAFGDVTGRESLSGFDVQADVNVELVDQLIADMAADGAWRLPGVVVLPPGAAIDDHRWLANWPEIGPAGGLDLLGLAGSASWREIVREACRHFPGHWVAGVAFHH